MRDRLGYFVWPVIAILIGCAVVQAGQAHQLKAGEPVGHKGWN
jgi:EamA domain-containing membrane protein RarD